MDNIQYMKTKGFTIIELIIVIVVIGVLAGLVLNSFQNVQSKARDTERLTDISAMATQMELFYQDNNGYPVLAGQLNSDTWISSNIKGSDLDLFRTPNSLYNSITDTTNPTIAEYGLKTYTSDGTTSCNVSPCAKFKLFYKAESSGNLITKSSIN
jgi:prepilin-type N-terminal cleavage/methylation domain-containing protein